MAINELVFSNEPSPDKRPVQAEDLDEAHIGVRIYEEDAKVNLSKIAAIVGIEGSDARKGLVQEASRSKTVSGADGSVESWGISVRLAVATNKWDVKASLTIPAIAAAVELGMATASAAIDVRGYKGDLSDLLPKPTSLDVTTYASYIHAFGLIQQKIFADVANQVPELLTRQAAPAAGN
jgi:hypothetical protein